jgi:hypothetical protein
MRRSSLGINQSALSTHVFRSFYTSTVPTITLQIKVKEWGNLPCVLYSLELPAGTRPTSSCSAEKNGENQLGA